MRKYGSSRCRFLKRLWIELILILSTFSGLAADWEIADTHYPTDDSVVAGIIMDSGRLPADPANTDCSASINNAINQLYNDGGGTLFFPVGTYLCSKVITLKDNVLLRGDMSNVNGSDQTVAGTVFKCTYNGQYGIDREFISISNRSGLKNITIWYPNQSLDNVIPYSPTLGVRLDKSGQPMRTEEAIIHNVNLVNSYVGLSAAANFVRANVIGLYGSPLYIGMNQKASSDVPSYIDIHFAAKFWASSGLPGAPSLADLQTYLLANATGMKVGASDNVFAVNWQVEDYKIGFYFLDEGEGDINGTLYGFHASNCGIAMKADDTGPTFVINGFFQSIGDAVTIHNSGALFFNNCEFQSGSSYDVQYTWTGSTQRDLRFQNCTFNKRIQSGGTRFGVIDSTFNYTDGPSIILSSWLKSASITGNTYAYSGNPVNLNGAKASLVFNDPSVTFSEKCPTFDIHGYNKERKPAANHMIVVGTAGYAVTVDGTTDTSAVIQRALNDVKTLGGGVVFLPPYDEAGYAIRNPLAVPDGVELRSSSEGYHSFGSNSQIPGALLQIYHGRGITTPTIILGEGSGFKGFTIHYPEQFSNSLTPYSYTLHSEEDDVYIQNVQFLNSYDQMYLNGCDNYLIENIILTYIHYGVYAENCTNGRINLINCRDEWEGSGFSTHKGTAFNKDVLKTAILMTFKNCTNQEIFRSFAHRRFMLVDFYNTSARTLCCSMESCQGAIRVNGIPAAGIEMVGSSLRTDRDGGGDVIMFDINADPGDGDFKMFTSLLTGHPDTLLKVTDANVTIQNCQFRLEKDKASTYGFEVDGTAPNVVRVENCSFYSGPVGVNVAQGSGKRLELVGNTFYDGFSNPDAPAPLETVDPALLLNSTRLALVANFGLPEITCPMDLNNNPGNHGIKLLSTQYSRKRFGSSTSGIYFYTPTDTDTTLDFEVSQYTFTQGEEPSGAEIDFCYYDFSSGTIVVEYQLPGSSRWITAKTYNVSGGKSIKFGTISVPGTLFKKGTLLRLRTTGTQYFSYMSIRAITGMEKVPFAIFDYNQTPYFTSTPMTAAREATPYSYTAEVLDSNGDELTLRGITVPTWLRFNAANGVLSGTPSSSDVGTHSVILRVADTNSYSDQSFTVAVNAVGNDVPVITSRPATAGAANQLYSYTLTATDVDGDELTFIGKIVPGWLDFDVDTGALTGTPLTAGDYSVVLNVSDGTVTVPLSFTINVASQNLISNPSFETGNSAGWAFSTPDATSVITNTAADGTYAVALALTTAGTVSPVRQVISVMPNTDYIFTYWANFSSSVLTGSLTARLNVDGVKLKSTTRMTDPTDGWEQKQILFNSGVATSITLDIYADSGFTGVVFIDNFSLTAVAPPPPNKTWVSVSLSPANQTYNGTARIITATTIPSGKTVDITYNGSATAPINAGIYTVIGIVNEAMVQGGATGTLTVAMADQTLDFPTLGSQETTNVVTLTATASSGLTVTHFSVASGPAVVSGNSVSFTNSGTVVLSALQDGDGNYNAAPVANITFDVTKAIAAVSLVSTNQTYDGSLRVVTATTVPEGQAVEFTYDSLVTAPTHAGSYTVVGVINEAMYQGSVTGTLTVAKANQTINFPGIGQQEVTNTFNLVASSTSTFPVNFSTYMGNPATIAGTRMSFGCAGEALVLADQSGDGNWNAAPTVTNLFNLIGVITDVTPDNGTVSGGTEVVIDGLWLGDGGDITNVMFCDITAIIVSQSVHSVTVTTGVAPPAETNGHVVVQSVGFGTVVLTNAFTYRPVPLAPTAISAVDITDSQFTARWKNNDEFTTHYFVDVSESTNFTACTGSYSNWNVGASTACLVADLVDGETYYYRVRAANEHGSSLDSNRIETPVSTNTPYSDYELTNTVVSAGSGDVIDLEKFFSGSGMSYEVVANSHSNLVTATIVDTELMLDYAAGASGTASITLRVTDLSSGFWVENTITVSVAPPPGLTRGTTAFNPQNGLFEEGITVVNNSPTLTARAITLTVTNLSAGAELYNATGIDPDGRSEILWVGTLGAGAGMDFTLQYYTAQYGTVPTADVFASLSMEEPGETVRGRHLALSGEYRNINSSSSFLIEFPATPGNTYYIQYTDDLSNPWKTVQPGIVAPVNRVQWIDSGPPGTESAPGNAGNRFYRIIEAD